ncbi:Cd2+/Zn2+-exporting ATPase [Salinibacillus kushneri]|uniref:Cd(2+)-exporting ATPase n=1 Tax=Salinibacillus kushneri TaxID=237682 RepID=A0A1I0BH81_9BACI|nr:Cd2+/Zn2+-exporting ATPase [Salinibacillus kushneri]
MKHLDGVEDAIVNFGAAKIAVYGKTTTKDLEKAGAFENLKIKPENNRDKQDEEKESFWQKYSFLMIAILLILIGYLSKEEVGEKHFYTLIAFVGAILISGYPLLKTGYKNLFRLEFDMKTLMAIAVTGAVIIGEWGEGAIVVILFAISEKLEAFSMDKARYSIRSLMDLAPNRAIVRRHGQEMELAVEDIQVDDILLVKPGQKIAIDGIVTRGNSTVNQAAITGESVPVTKQQSDEVFAGTLNEEGFLEVNVTTTSEDTTLSKIIHLVEEAQSEKAPAQAFIDKFAKFYTPVIMAIALLVAVVPPLFGASWSDWIYQGLAVLVVGCPCALVVSTPVAIVTAIGTGARNGVLIKGGIYLEEIGALNAIAFDKTGTLTIGTPKVTDVNWLTEANHNQHLANIRALESHSQHPLGKALVSYTEDMEVTSEIDISDFTSITGKGIKGQINGKAYWMGNTELAYDRAQKGLSESAKQQIRDLQNSGKTVMLYGDEIEVIAVFAVRDEPREESQNILNQVHSLGVPNTVMLTGDHKETAQAIAKEIGVKHVKAQLLPQKKLHFIKDYQKKYGKVGMVGDGINDAPALATADAGIAMGGAGTDTALETADLALMGDDLSKLPFTIRLSKKALSIIKQNITFAIGIKILALLLVIPGWLTLWIAIFADMGATLLVTLNALRLLRV